MHGVLVVTHWVLVFNMGASLVAIHELTGPLACEILVPQPGIEPVSPALQGRFVTAGPPGKTLLGNLNGEGVERRREEGQGWKESVEVVQRVLQGAEICHVIAQGSAPPASSSLGSERPEGSGWARSSLLVNILHFLVSILHFSESCFLIYKMLPFS